MPTAAPTVTSLPQPADVHTFRFHATPLSDVLSTLSAYYDVSLSAPSSALGKRLTGNFEATQLADIVAMIEQVLDVKVAVDE